MKIFNFKFSVLNFSQGFTIMEFMVVLGILVIVGGLGLFMSLDSYRGFMFRNERDTVVSVLQKARSQAINNICLGSGCIDGKNHGVYFGQAGSYIVFQGTDYAHRDSGVDLNMQSNSATVTLSGLNQVVFSQLSGDVTGPGNITVADSSGHNSVISVNAEGQISWTK